MEANLKRLALHVAAAACFTLSSGMAGAQGVPTTDIKAIVTQVTNQVEQIKKWATQFKQMEAQINQYKEQYKALTGPRGMAALLDSPMVKAALPPEFTKLVTTIKSTTAYVTERKKYPTVKGFPALNQMYDVIAAQNASTSDLYSKTQSRLAQVQSLMAKIDTANDPAAKADLTNRLISEQNAIQGTMSLIEVLETKQEQELQEAARNASREVACKEFKRATC